MPSARIDAVDAGEGSARGTLSGLLDREDWMSPQFYADARTVQPRHHEEGFDAAIADTNAEPLVNPVPKLDSFASRGGLELVDIELRECDGRHVFAPGARSVRTAMYSDETCRTSDSVPTN